MNCPTCRTSDGVHRTLSRTDGGYVAAIICFQCDRQVAITHADPGVAIDKAENLFLKGGSPDGGQAAADEPEAP